jgi:predicted SAM-dependent methyltransferase
LEACRQALRNSFLVLRDGGTFRLIVPDLKARAEQYLLSHEPEAAHEFLKATFLGRVNKKRGLLGRLLETLSNSDHLWMYDENSMRVELARAGFVSVRRCAIGDSADRMFDRVENQERFFDRGIVELAMECKTPS